jgi:two-component system sensor histidine kinase DesK
LLTGGVAAAVRPATAWPDAVVAAVATAAGTAAVLAQVWIGDAAARERDREAAAAVVRERLRFAAELHDIQGHSLQVIVLKSELAARLADRDVARAAAEMREVETLARDALRDTRDVVHGYRAVSLTTEVGNAVRVLAAAGIDCRTTLAAGDDVPAFAGRLLALVVREATTNILRYGTGGPADISLTAGPAGLRLTVGNSTDPVTAPGPAGGLADLAARFEAAHGTLRYALTGSRFEVVADLPAGAGA